MRFLFVIVALAVVFTGAPTANAQSATPPAPQTTVIQLGDGYTVELVHQLDYGQVFIVLALLLVLGVVVIKFIFELVERGFTR